MKILATARHAAITLTRAAAVVGAVVGALAATPACALTVYVRVGQFTQPMPDGTQVPMWGYRVGATQAAALAGRTTAPLFGLSSPGAAITVPYNDTTLVVRLLNTLPVPTSFVLHGQNAVMTPVFTNTAGVTGCTPGTTTDCRVRSFTHETPPGNATPVDYVFTNVKPGTYLYQSGTLPQVQVQMGLYGLMRKNATPTPLSGFNAYDNVPFSNEIALLFSEVDPALHAAVAAGTFTGSTLAYDPKHFRTHRYVSGANVVPTDVTANPSRGPTTIQPGQPLLLRMLNAGLQSRSMVLDDGHWYVMAEDGNPYPYPREQYSVFLPAAKTADVWLTPTIINTAAASDSNTITLFDRALALTNNNADPVGGMLFQMRATTAAPPPTIDVTSCVPIATQGASYICSAIAAGAGTSRYALDIAPVGMSIDETSGAIAWVPTNDQAQRPADPTLTIPMRVRAVDGNGSVAVSPVVAIAVANVNDAPLAVNDTYTVRGGSLVIASPLLSVRANDSDPDGDPLGTVSLVAGPATVGDSLTLNADGTFSFTATNYTVDRLASFSYRVVDSSNLPSNAGIVTLNVKANVAPRTIEDTVAAVFNVYNATNPLLIDVLANDSDADGNLDPNSLVIVGAPNRGGTATVVSGANGRQWVRYVPPLGFRGTEAITYTVADTAPAPLRSVATTLRINIQ